MRIDILTLFPNMIESYFGESMLKRAVENGILDIRVHDLRSWADEKNKITDDRPFGGGAGMLLKPEPIFAAIEELQSENCTKIYMCPDGEVLTSDLAKEFSEKEHIIILSGHYEGVDQRVRDCIIDREVSIGDYVLTNGTISAAVLIDATARYIKGVLGEEKSLTSDSFTDNLLSFPQYTRPAEFRGMKVPEVLMSGNHAKIAEARRQWQVEKTNIRRPDILKKEIK